MNIFFGRFIKYKFSFQQFYLSFILILSLCIKVEAQNISPHPSTLDIASQYNGNKVTLPYGETEFSNIFTINSTKITLSNIEFNLKEFSKNTKNTPPRADAGNKKIGSTKELITLDARNSFDEESELSYRWRQVGNSKNKINLINPTTSQPHFTVPDLTFAEVINFELTVTDSEGLSNTDNVSVIIYPHNVSNIFYHPATEDKAWLYNGNETYISTGKNGESGLRIYKKVYKGD